MSLPKAGIIAPAIILVVFIVLVVSLLITYIHRPRRSDAYALESGETATQTEDIHRCPPSCESGKTAGLNFCPTIAVEGQEGAINTWLQRLGHNVGKSIHAKYGGFMIVSPIFNEDDVHGIIYLKDEPVSSASDEVATSGGKPTRVIHAMTSVIDPFDGLLEEIYKRREGLQSRGEEIGVRSFV
jgi:hypothetical protein